MFSDEVQNYIHSYEVRREYRCRQFDAVFLPLEELTEKSTGITHLSVSFGGSGSRALYITQRADIFRAVKLAWRFFLLPYTESRLFEKKEFLKEFHNLFETKDVDGEDFWFINSINVPPLKKKISGYTLGNEFRDLMDHRYLTTRN